MNENYALLVKCGGWAIIFGYVFRYLWPMLALLFWQTLLGPIVRATGAKLPDNNKEFFYAPKIGEQIAFHWFHPNHQIAIPVLFAVGVVLGYFVVYSGEQGYEVLLWSFPIVATLLAIWRGAQWAASKDGLAIGLERAFFTASTILESFLVMAVIRQAINT